MKQFINIFIGTDNPTWERGTNENTNGLIRRFFPKGTDFNNIILKQIKEAEYSLNNRPRKVLGYKTPTEKLSEEINPKAPFSEITFGSLKSLKSYSENRINF